MFTIGIESATLDHKLDALPTQLCGHVGVGLEMNIYAYTFIKTYF